MNLKFLAGGLLGSAITLAISAVAQAPRSKLSTECTDSRQVVDLLLSISSETGALPKMERQLGTLAEHDGILGSAATNRGEDVWAREVDTKLDQIASQIMLQTQMQQLRH